MKKAILLLMFGIIFQCNVFSQQIITGSFNLRYANRTDTGNLWPDRGPVCANLIRFHNFDVIGTQEGLVNQIKDLNTWLPEYNSYGVGRDDGAEKGEHSTIFYKKDKFILLDKGDFWLSETPEKPGFGWDARFNRICSWVKLKEKKSKKTFYFFSVHFDHQAKVARVESGKLITKKIQEIAGKTAAVLVGDFNGGHETEWYNYIHTSGVVSDVLQKATQPYLNNGTFSAFKISGINKNVIDHIFATPDFKVIRYGVLTDTYYGKFPSDHFPVLAELSW